MFPERTLRIWGLIWALILLIYSSDRCAELLKYRLIIENPQEHVARVHLTAPVDGQDTLTLAMPAWSPGRYVIYNFAQNVFDVQITGNDGQKIKPLLIDKQTWKIPVSGVQQIEVRYRVYAHTLDGTFSFIDSLGASINGASVFAYIVEEKNRPIELRVKVPDQWQVVCALDPFASDGFQAASYDQLIDSPIEMGRLFPYHFKTLGEEHVLVFHQEIKPALLRTFKRDLQKVIRYFATLFDGALPYDHYTFFFHLNKRLQHTDGMEHANACRVLLRMDAQQVDPDANSDADYDNLIWLSAHEFFHTWNVKRLRPRGLGPFDYSREVYTPSLWIVEGWTSYYAYLALLRTGIYSQEKFLSELSGRITRYENSPGKKYRTLAETSVLTWLFKGGVPQYAETNIEQTTYSYYYKGLIAGFLLDILLRSQPQKAASLDALLHEMWTVFYKNKKSDYFLSGEGYLEQQIEQMIVQKLGNAGQTFLQTAVHSTRPLPYDLVQKMGLLLKKEPSGFRLVKKKSMSPQEKERWARFVDLVPDLD